MNIASERPSRILAPVVLFVLLGFFFWSAQSVLSPLVIGGILLFFLYGLWERPLARRLSGVVIVVMVIWVFLKAQIVFMPLIFAFILAYLFDPLVEMLEDRKIPRLAGALLVLALALGILILIGAILIPGLVSEIQYLLKMSQNLPDRLLEFIQTNLPKALEFFKVDPEIFKEKMTEQVPTGVDQALSGLQKSVAGAGNFLGRLLNLVLIPVMTFYLLKDFKKLEGWFMGLIPRGQRSVAAFYLWRFNRILGGYLRAQVIVCAFVGVATGVGLALMGIPSAALIGVVTGLLNIIPFLGFYTSLALALLVGFTAANPISGLVKVVSVFLIVQTIEAYIVTPKIVGDKLGLHPVSVMFSVLIFSKFFGFWGLLIGVPTAAVIKFFMDEWKRRQKRQEMLDAARHGT